MAVNYPDKRMIEYLPWHINDVTEMIRFMDIDDETFDIVKAEIDKFMDNRFIQTADADMIAQWEDLLSIQADPANETLEFRRQRLLTRLSLSLPYTTPYVRQRLDGILGVGNYTLSIDYSTYTINLDIQIAQQAYYDEVVILLTLIKPANMVLNVSFIYTTYDEVGTYTHDQLSAYTHQQIRTTLGV